ncbi:glycoside hydrolase family 31 protein [Stemphylium lycopersici]|nr:glycoside hydrolase family 31 protein [Stemphylium lycopersici]
MTRSSLLQASTVLSSLLTLTSGQTSSSSSEGGWSTTLAGTLTSFNPVFTIPPTADQGVTQLPNIYDPQAVDAQDVCPGYKASDLEENDKGLSATLTLAGKPCNIYGIDVDELDLQVEYQAKGRLAVNITPKHLEASNRSHWVVPEDLIPRPQAEDSFEHTDLKFNWGNEPSFWFNIERRSTGDVIFTTKGTHLIYENQFVEVVNSLPEDYNLYGLGERIHGLRLNNNFTATIYAADVGDPIDRNLYGSHPFYLETRYFNKGSNKSNTPLKQSELHQDSFGYDGKPKGSPYESRSHGVYYRNTHGMDVVLKPDHLSWRTLGGAIDLFFYDGPSQPEVTKEYQKSAVGLPAMQQYWTFGYHQCRWGYRNWTELRGIVETLRDFDIPMETIWLDIDYMDQYRDFTLDPVTFPPSNVTEFFGWLHGNNQHFVPIVDAAIYIPNPQNASDAYDTYTRGNESGVFMTNPDGSQYIGAVWPGYTVFPDWLSSNGVSWWVKEMVEWYKEVPFSGFWVDMTEVSSFCVGSCGTGNVTMNPVHPPFSLPGEVGNIIYDYPEGFNITNGTEAASASAASSSQAGIPATSTATETTEETSTTTSYFRSTPTPGERNVDYPPYVINHVQAGADLAVHAVSPNATHQNGVQEYDIHNLFGHQIINATYQGLLSVFPGKRPFIIGRSTFAGSGKWAGHWGGDNASKWAYMFFSIPQALSFSLFGIPMFGVDTCGFNGNTDMELCARWMQLSAFFPFYRNHNTLSALSQEPFRWDAVASASRTAMHIRYSLLPYMYTLFNDAHTTGSTVMRALAWEFPNEPQLAGVDTQFMLGPNILVTPVLEPQVDTVNGVFPGIVDGETWFDWYSGERVQAEAGVNTTISAPLGHIPVYIRGGSVLPTQEPGYTTTESRQNPWGLIVALSSEGAASGSLYIDDGESIEPESCLDVTFAAMSGHLKVDVEGEFKDTNALANVTILGAPAVGQVKLNGETVDADKHGVSTLSNTFWFLSILCHISFPFKPPFLTMPPRKLNQQAPSPVPSEDELKTIAAKSSSPESQLQEAAATAESALESAKTASSLRSAAETIKDPAKREKYLQDAYNKEIEAHGNSKKARVLSSGAFQGSVGGGGIGMAVGAGLGTVVGTLVGTVATIPTTAVGTLVGAGVGGVHGPWVKLGGGKKGEKEEKETEGNTHEEKVAGEMQDKVGDEEEGIPDPEALRRAADEFAQQRRAEGEKSDSETKEKRKPRKLEMRGKQTT